MVVGLLGNESSDSNRLTLVTPKSENDVRLQATLDNQNPTGLPVGVVSAYVVCYFVGLNTGIIAWISAIIFSLYIGYDFVSAQQAKHTVANAIIYGADIYLDLVNLFVEILRILKDND